MAPNGARRLTKITLEDGAAVHRGATIEHERRVAIFDLLEENNFSLVGEKEGPYHLTIALEDNRLLLDVSNIANARIARVRLPLSPFRRIVRDYFTICEAYYDSIKTSTPSKIEAIDMGRGALHDEGALLLMERLAEKIHVDADTSRRLFTLICVLHVQG